MRDGMSKQDTAFAYKGMLQRTIEEAKEVRSAQIFDKKLGCIYLDTLPD